MKTLVVLDIETYPNYWLLAVKSLEKGTLITMEIYGKENRFDSVQMKRIRLVLAKHTTFGFNSNNYDMPMIMYALSGKTCSELYVLSKDIIENRKPDWLTYRDYDIDKPRYDHFDIAEPSPAVMISLKNYGTRIGSKKLWDLPFDPHKPVTKNEAKILKDYCENDLDVTIDLYRAIADRIELRVSMGDTYGLDLRSKSDAQIAEAIFEKRIGKQKRVDAKSRLIKEIKYKAPDFIKFESPHLEAIKDLFESCPIPVNQANGQPKLPLEWTKLIKPKIGNTVYKLGLGGVHSQEKSVSIKSTSTMKMRNADIASMYPSIIVTMGLYPKTLGNKFLDIYSNIKKTRLEAKASGDKLVNESLKIVLNSSYGKFGSFYSFLYAPDLMLTVTLTGQLMMLMLIEQLELHGIEVISANTDGVEYYCHVDKTDLAHSLIFDWELITGMDMEHGEYLALHASNVNNYVAVYDGYTKAKGLYAETSLSKGRSTPVIYEAIRKYLLDGTAMETTITNCTDMNQFVSARTVKGGGVYGEEYLGKMVRWHYSLESKGCISYKTNGNKVPKTDRCYPMMELTETIPKDLDYVWYFEEAVSKLKDLGVEYEK